MLSKNLITLLATMAGVAIAVALPANPPTPVDSAPLAKRTTHTGTGTTYTQGGAAGSCGNYNSDSSIIAALGNYWMDGEYDSPYCGRYIKATNIGSNDGVGGDGNVVDVLVQDTCESCGEGDVDFSTEAWDALTNNAEPGTFTVSWNFCAGTSPC